MDAPKTLTFIDPKSLIHMLSIESGGVVADFGAGSGHFSFECAQAVGPEGKVYALDVLPAALESVASQAKTRNLTNIIPQRCNLERPNGSGLETSSIDWVIAKDVLFQNQDKTMILRDIARILKPSGKAVIIEWDPKETLMGPDRNMRIATEVLKELIEKADLKVLSEPSVGGFHYAFLVARKSS